MPTIVSRIERRVPAARIAPKDDPYSTMRRSCRFHQTRCGMWCTSGCAPVAIDVRHTGVSDGNVVTARRYVPASASRASVGAERSSTALSNTDGVRPSMTMRTAPLLGKRAEAGVLLSGALTCAQRERGDRNRLEEADERDQPERKHADGCGDEQNGGSRRGAAAAHGAAREDTCAVAAERAGHGTGDRGLPVEHEPRENAARNERDQCRGERSSSRPGEQPRGRDAERRADARGDADQPDLVHATAV